MSLTPSRNEELWKAHDGTVCPACKNNKGVGKPFCYPCYNSLPVKTKKELAATSGSSFIDAYETALEYLSAYT